MTFESVEIHDCGPVTSRYFNCGQRYTFLARVPGQRLATVIFWREAPDAWKQAALAGRDAVRLRDARS